MPADEYRHAEAEDVESLRWFEDGYVEGRYAAEVNLEIDRDEMFDAYQEGTLGEIAQEIREHQTQMAGDLSYEVDRPGGPTEDEYESWENGFYQGFHDGVAGEANSVRILPPDPLPPDPAYQRRALAGVRVKPHVRHP